MDWQAVCAAVIPCLNEETAIGPLVTAVRRHVSAVFVIDDGSTDGTATRAAAADATVLRHSTSLGKGAALRTGWAKARESGYTWALALDGDGQHAPENIPVFFNACERSSARLVIGNRMHQADRMPWLRRCVNVWMSRQMSKLAGRELPDSQCGFRLMNLEDWARLPVRASHFEIESEIALLFARAGLAIEFVPIEVIYRNEQTKIRPWRDTMRWLRWRRGARNKKPQMNTNHEWTRINTN
jgi:glycosyltransferase involved in cell wall biosynthesis